MTITESGDKEIEPGFLTRSEISGTIPPTPRVELVAAVAELQAHKDSWVTLALDERIAILDQVLDDLHAVQEEWVSASIKAKGTQGNNFAEAEEWAIFAYAMRCMRLMKVSLRDIQRSGRPQIPGPIDTSPDGQVHARVFPVDRYDSLIFSGMTAVVSLRQIIFHKSVTTEMSTAVIHNQMIQPE